MPKNISRSALKITNAARSGGSMSEYGVELISLGDLRNDGRVPGAHSGNFRYVYVRVVGGTQGPTDHRFKMYESSALDDSLADLFAHEVDVGCRYFVFTVSTREGDSDLLVEKAMPGVPISEIRNSRTIVTSVAAQAPVTAKCYRTSRGVTQVALKIPLHFVADQMFPNDIEQCYVHMNDNGEIVVMPSEHQPNSTFEWGIQCKDHVTAYLKGVALGQPESKGVAPEIAFVMRPFAQGMKLCSAVHWSQSRRSSGGFFMSGRQNPADAHSDVGDRREMVPEAAGDPKACRRPIPLAQDERKQGHAGSGHSAPDSHVSSGSGCLRPICQKRRRIRQKPVK